MSADADDSIEVGSPNGGVRDRAKRLRKQRIIEAAARLLLAKGFHEITTKEVAAEAGVGEATLFRYIRSKHDLLTLVYGDQLDQVLNQIERDDTLAARQGSSPPTAASCVSRVLEIYRKRCDFYLINPDNAALYLREGFVLDNPESPRHIAQGDRTIRLVTSILRDGQDRGVLTSRVDPFVVAQNCHGAYMHEIDRTPVRGLPPSTIWERLERRLRVQLEPLAIDVG